MCLWAGVIVSLKLSVKNDRHHGMNVKRFGDVIVTPVFINSYDLCLSIEEMFLCSNERQQKSDHFTIAIRFFKKKEQKYYLGETRYDIT